MLPEEARQSRQDSTMACLQQLPNPCDTMCEWHSNPKPSGPQNSPALQLPGLNKQAFLEQGKQAVSARPAGDATA